MAVMLGEPAEMMRLVVLLLWAGLIGAGGWWGWNWTKRHPQHVPWAPLSLDQPVGHFTAFKLGRMRNDFPACRSLLDTAGIDYRVLPPVEAGPTCGYADGIRATSDGRSAYAPAVSASCVMVSGLHLWERESVQVAAERHFGQPVVSMRTFGTYACRRIGNGSRGQFSEHASANAIDIAGFTLRGGKQISVAGDWSGGGPEAAFLREVRDGACRIFGTTLSPDYNAAHHDHFHFDQASRGGFTVCR